MERSLRLQIETAERSHNETIDLAIRAFELSQNLRAKWFAADVAAKRRILEILCLNWTLDGVTLTPELRKPFDVLIKGLPISSSRGDWTAIELFADVISTWEPDVRELLSAA